MNKLYYKLPYIVNINMRVFAVNLKKEREYNEYTQIQMANLLNIPLKTYQSYEAMSTGHREPDLELIIKIADILKVTTDYLLGRTK